MPNSGWKSDNVRDPSANTQAWFKGWETIYTAQRRQLHHRTARPTDKPLSLALQDACQFVVLTVAVGPSRTGVLRSGMVGIFALTINITEVKFARMHHEACSGALPGNSVGFNVKNASVRYVPHDNEQK